VLFPIEIFDTPVGNDFDLGLKLGVMSGCLLEGDNPLGER
jgi:hypothetical protein